MIFGYMARITGCVALLTLLLPLAAYAAPDNEKRIALVIGVGTYQNQPQLPNAVNDARAIGESLQRLKFDVTELYDPGTRELNSAVREFGIRASTAGTAVIYYAGHGIQADGQNYLLPADTKLERERDLPYEAMPFNLLLDEVSQVSQIGIVLLDSCRKNPFSEHLGGSTTIAGRTVAIAPGLARVDVPRNTVVLMAAKAGQVAEDGDEHSPFAAAVLAHFQIPGLELDLFARSVRDTVLRATSNRQEPFVFSSRGIEPFYFHPRPPNRPPEIGAVTPLEVTEAAGPTPLRMPEPTDPDQDPLSIRIIGLPRFGEVRVEGRPVSVNKVVTSEQFRTATYKPDGKSTGPAGTVDILVEDGRGGSVTASLPITVQPVTPAAAADRPAAGPLPPPATDKPDMVSDSRPPPVSPPVSPQVTMAANGPLIATPPASPVAGPGGASRPQNCPTCPEGVRNPAGELGSMVAGPADVHDLTIGQRPIWEFTQQQAAAVSALPPARRLDVDAWVDRRDQTYRLGQPLTVSVRPRTDAYVTILNYGTSGRMTVVFPNQFQQDNRVRAGRIVQVPPAGAPFRLASSGPAGVELLQVIVSSTPLALPEVGRLGTQQNDGPFVSLGRSAEEVARDLSLQITPPVSAVANGAAPVGPAPVSPASVSPASVSKVVMVRVLADTGAIEPSPMPIPVLLPAPDTVVPAVGAKSPIVVRTNKNAYRVGEPVQVTVAATRPCALTLLITGPSGAIHQLFPNAQQPATILMPGQIVTVPPPNSGIQIVASGPAGIETIVGVCLQGGSAGEAALQSVLTQRNAPATPRDLALFAAQPDTVGGQAAAAYFVTP